MLKRNNMRVPDILDCLANLSSDEVFTPPEVANKMLDLLPQELFKSKETTFLDPFTKSGVFLREITKRLLSHQMPNYELMSSEIDEIEKSAIQNAVKNRELDLNDIEYSEKAKKIGRDAINNHEKVAEFHSFEESLQKELNRILKTQVFGIAITELTAQLTRRSLYCSKDASGKYSISTDFHNIDGNIRFKSCQHVWNKEPKWDEKKEKFVGGTCVFCGASSEMFERPNDLEQHAYEFIHTKNIKEIFNMKFDVVCGNPPYQLNDGGGVGSSAIPLYNKFIESAKKLNPKYLTMIIPSRWMTGGRGLDSFRDTMIRDKHIIYLYDFADEKECFPSVEIKGGVCYFLRDRDVEKKCEIHRFDSSGEHISTRYLVEDGDDIFIRDETLLKIKKKVFKDSPNSIASIVSARKPYGLAADTIEKTEKYGLPPFSNTKIEGGIEIIGLEKLKRVTKYAASNYPVPKDIGIGKWKIFIPKAYGCGEIGEVPSTPVLGTPVLGTPVQICTETFLQIGPFDTKEEAENMLSYLKTKFFRALVGIRKQTQNTSQKTYQYVPMQDFSKSWTDEELYKKYKLTSKEIEFIEKSISSFDKEPEKCEENISEKQED